MLGRSEFGVVRAGCWEYMNVESTLAISETPCPTAMKWILDNLLRGRVIDQERGPVNVALKLCTCDIIVVYHATDVDFTPNICTIQE